MAGPLNPVVNTASDSQECHGKQHEHRPGGQAFAGRRLIPRGRRRLPVGRMLSIPCGRRGRRRRGRRNRARRLGLSPRLRRRRRRRRWWRCGLPRLRLGRRRLPRLRLGRRRRGLPGILSWRRGRRSLRLPALRRRTRGRRGGGGVLSRPFGAIGAFGLRRRNVFPAGRANPIKHFYSNVYET